MQLRSAIAVLSAAALCVSAGVSGVLAQTQAPGNIGLWQGGACGVSPCTCYCSGTFNGVPSLSCDPTTQACATQCSNTCAAAPYTNECAGGQTTGETHASAAAETEPIPSDQTDGTCIHSSALGFDVWLSCTTDSFAMTVYRTSTPATSAQLQLQQQLLQQQSQRTRNPFFARARPRARPQASVTSGTPGTCTGAEVVSFHGSDSTCQPAPGVFTHYSVFVTCPAGSGGSDGPAGSTIGIGFGVAFGVIGLGVAAFFFVRSHRQMEARKAAAAAAAAGGAQPAVDPKLPLLGAPQRPFMASGQPQQQAPQPYDPQQAALQAVPQYVPQQFGAQPQPQAGANPYTPYANPNAANPYAPAPAGNASPYDSGPHAPQQPIAQPYPVPNPAQAYGAAGAPADAGASADAGAAAAAGVRSYGAI